MSNVSSSSLARQVTLNQSQHREHLTNPISDWVQTFAVARSFLLKQFSLAVFLLIYNFEIIIFVIL